MSAGMNDTELEHFVASSGHRFLPIRTFHDVFVGFATALGRANDERDREIAELRQTAAELKARIGPLVTFTQQPFLKDAEVWTMDVSYVAGDCVSHEGSLWIAKQASRDVRPGANPACWRLAVKHGRDGRDAR
jgi:hypothetical protein